MDPQQRGFTGPPVKTTGSGQAALPGVDLALESVTGRSGPLGGNPGCETDSDQE